MNILLSGALEGNLVDFYKNIVPQYAPHWIVCVGDYGIHPDPHFMDRAAKKHAGRDFAKMYVGALVVPVVPTLTIAGVHDDQRFLNHRVAVGNTEILTHVHYLHQGYRTQIGWESAVRVTGIGRAYSEATYKEEPTKRSYRHYTRREIERACSSGPTDLFVCYEHLDAPGIKNAIYATRPKLILTVTHPNRKVYTEIQGTRVVSLGRKEVKLVTWNGNSFV